MQNMNITIKRKKSFALQAKIRNRYTHVPHLTQNIIWESDKNIRIHHTQESQEISHFIIRLCDRSDCFMLFQIRSRSSHCQLCCFNNIMDNSRYGRRSRLGTLVQRFVSYHKLATRKNSFYYRKHTSFKLVPDILV